MYQDFLETGYRRLYIVAAAQMAPYLESQQKGGFRPGL
jgi:hypothetical protein